MPHMLEAPVLRGADLPRTLTHLPSPHLTPPSHPHKHTNTCKRLPPTSLTCRAWALPSPTPTQHQYPTPHPVPRQPTQTQQPMHAPNPHPTHPPTHHHPHAAPSTPTPPHTPHAPLPPTHLQSLSSCGRRDPWNFSSPSCCACCPCCVCCAWCGCRPPVRPSMAALACRYCTRAAIGMVSSSCSTTGGQVRGAHSLQGPATFALSPALLLPSSTTHHLVSG